MTRLGLKATAKLLWSWPLVPTILTTLLLSTILLQLPMVTSAAGLNGAKVHPRGLIIEFKDNLDVNTALDQFRKEAAQNNIDLDVTSVYTSIIKAVSVYTKDPHDQAVIDKLNKFSSVAKVYNTKQYGSGRSSGGSSITESSTPPLNGPVKRDQQKPQDSSTKTKTNFTITSIDGSVYDIHKLTGVDKLHARGLTGKGIKIGIIDSGVDYHHPELGNCWKTPGCPFQYGFDFVGDKYPSEGDVHTTDEDPYTGCNGHGSHVAGIIAGQGPLVKGVAPGATLGMYRVFNCVGNGNESDEVILKAMEKAYQDGMDIISISLGVDGWSENPTAVAASRLADKGVIVVAAAGNAGESGIFTAIRPGLGKGVISVAASEGNAVVNRKIDVVQAPPGGSKWTIMPYYSNNTNYVSSKTPIGVVLAADSEGSSYGCLPYTNGSELKGKVVLVERGSCSFTDKALNAQKAGGVALLVATKETSSFEPSIDAPIDIPVGLLLKADSDKLLSQVKSSAVTVSTGDDGFGVIANDQVGKISTFSSWGPNPELDVGISLTGPGGNIFSTVPIPQGSYETMSGTSMATPYISGVFALMLEAKGKKNVEQLKSLVTQNTKLIPSDVTGRSNSAIRQGHGFVDVVAALNATIVANPTALQLNFTASPADFTKTLNITNLDSKKPLVATLRHIPALSFSSYDSDGKFTNPPRNTTEAATVQIPTSITVGPGETATIRVTISSPEKLPRNERWFYSGFIQIKQQSVDGSNTVNIPYTGFKGQYTDLPLLPYDDAEQMPRFNYHCSKTSDPVSVFSNTTYVINNDESYISLNVTTVRPSRIVKMELVDAKTNKTLGYMPNGYTTYKGPNNDESQYPLATKVTGILYNGSDLKDKTVYSDGTYKIKLSGLKLFGNPESVKDYETWETIPFNIKFSGQATCP